MSSPRQQLRSGSVVPSLSIRAAASYLDVHWPQVALTLGTGLRIGGLVVPTDPAMRLLMVPSGRTPLVIACLI